MCTTESNSQQPHHHRQTGIAHITHHSGGDTQNTVLIAYYTKKKQPTKTPSPTHRAENTRARVQKKHNPCTHTVRLTIAEKLLITPPRLSKVKRKGYSLSTVTKPTPQTHTPIVYRRRADNPQRRHCTPHASTEEYPWGGVRN